MAVTSAEVIKRLRKEGCRLSPGYISFLTREYPVLRPSGRAGSYFIWEESDISRLRAALRERGRGPGGNGGR